MKKITISIMLILATTLNVTASNYKLKITKKAKAQCKNWALLADRELDAGNIQDWLKYRAKHGRCLAIKSIRERGKKLMK